MSEPEISSMPELKKQRDPVAWLAKKGLEISPVGDSDLLEVAYAGADPVKSARLVNAVIDSYFVMRNSQRNVRTQRMIEVLEEEQSRRQTEISRRHSHLRDLQGQLDPALAPAALGTDVIVASNPLQDYTARLSDARVKEQLLAAEVKVLEESINNIPKVPQVLVENTVDNSPHIQETVALINTKRAMLNRITAYSTKGENDPAYRRIQNEITRLERSLTSARAEARPRVQQLAAADSLMVRQEQLGVKQTQLQSQRLHVQLLDTEYQDKVKEANQSGGVMLQLQKAQAELENERQVYNSIAQRLTQLKTEMGAPNRVESLERAKVPPTPLEVLPFKFLAASILASLCLPFGIAVLRERSVRRVTSVEQLETQSTIPVMGEIARLPARAGYAVNGSSRTFGRELGLFEESIDSLRTGLILGNEDNDIQVLAVTSAVSGEGKTSIASQLAVSIARSSGKPTLLIDGDMRKPDIHRIFQIENLPGLVNVLDGETELEAAINRSWSDHVHLLPAGDLHKNPHKLLGTDSFEEMLAQARLHYRYIIIDTPPVLAASESLVMAKAADATLICAMRDVSRESHIKMTRDRLLSTGARPIGTVLNGVPTRQYTQRYGNYAYQS